MQSHLRHFPKKNTAKRRRQGRIIRVLDPKFATEIQRQCSPLSQVGRTEFGYKPGERAYYRVRAIKVTDGGATVMSHYEKGTLTEVLPNTHDRRFQSRSWRFGVALKTRILSSLNSKARR